MKTVLFWVITQRVVANFTDVSGQPIGPVLRVQEFKNLRVRPVGCPETSGINYHY